MNYEQVLTYVYIGLIAIVLILLIVLAVEKHKAKKSLWQAKQIGKQVRDNIDIANQKTDEIKDNLADSLPPILGFLAITTTLKLFRKNYKKTKSVKSAAEKTYIKRMKPVKKAAKIYLGI
ncbi:MAG: hypothetical protein Q4F55_04640 [Bacillota bacterium]|nr:hypothetical protein [Erysipelotrichaceae bacterium]MDO5441825.1 hypothetical protein [Bacillota bacterium]